MQKLVNAYVETLTGSSTHTPAEIADKMPADYYAGVGKAAYVEALESEKGIYNQRRPDARRRPADVLNVLSALQPRRQGQTIDLAKTYTNSFVQAATPIT